MDTRRDVLLVGLEQPELQPLVDRIAGWAQRTTQVATLNAALNNFRARPHPLAILDADALDVLDAAEVLLRLEPSVSLVVLSRRPELAEAVRAGSVGVAEYIGIDTSRELPLDWLMERIELAWDFASLKAPAGRTDDQPIPSIIGRSRVMRQVGELIRLVAPRQSTVLIIGRTGTGKELVAKAVHDGSPRAAHSLVNVNCGAIPDGSSPRQRAEFRRQLPEFASVMGWIGRSASVYRLLVRQRNPQRIEDFCLAGVGNRQPCDAGLLIHSIFQ